MTTKNILYTNHQLVDLNIIFLLYSCLNIYIVCSPDNQG